MKTNKNMTIGDIAEALGVSKSTVSRAISGKGRIGEGTTARILAYIEEHDYHPNVIAQSLAGFKTSNICIALPIDNNLTELSYFHRISMGICNYLSTENYDGLLATYTSSDIQNLQRIIMNQKVDGVIITRMFQDGLAVKYLKEQGIPFIALGMDKDKKMIQLDANHRQACKDLTYHLLRKGITKLALLGGDSTHIVSKERYHGFMEAHDKAGVSPHMELCYENVNNTARTEACVDDLMQKGAECIICMDDNICTRVIRKLDRDRIEIPKQIKVASFFGNSFLQNNIPPITCLEYNVEEFGMLAAKLMLKVIDKEQVSPYTTINYRLNLRESTEG
ncbi:MAG: LacI family DNA-binding transcriptional regulator [Lachnospiraceae bacterium]|nr:LacI family DNA-binding transcriptional regulator [Lachnospiraceae bacterium]